MKYCCETCKHEFENCPSVSAYFGVCDGWEKKPVTNADRIRAMTDEELAAKIEELCQYTFMQISVYEKPFGKEEWLEWLKQEVNDEKYCQ